MLFVLTWTLFWKVYCLVFFGMVSVPAISSLIDHLKQSPAFSRVPETELELCQVQLVEQEAPPVILTKIKVDEQKVAQVEPGSWHEEKPKPRNFPRGPRRIAVELAACLNEVQDNTATEWELVKTLRKFIRQHPRLRKLSYREAVQELIWIEDDPVGPAYASEMEVEW